MQVPQTPMKSIFRKTVKLEDMYLFKKAIVIDQLTACFCSKFLPAYGDRTVDQMIQASRSCKQNIVEGSEDGKTSMEMEIKLINVARASLGELRQDYEDYLRRNHLQAWQKEDTRYDAMLTYCRTHNNLEDFESMFQLWSAEEMCNWALTLCHMEDKMLTTHLENLQTEFVTEGGIKERMTASRLGFRTNQQEAIDTLQHQNQELQHQNQELQKQNQELQKQTYELQRQNQELLKENELLKQQVSQWQSAYEDLKRRAVKAWDEQQQRIQELEGRK